MNNDNVTRPDVGRVMEAVHNREQRRAMNRITKRLMRRHPKASIQELAEMAATEFREGGFA